MLPMFMPQLLLKSGSHRSLVPGGLVIIDDYGTCFGSRKAVDEFRVNRNITTPLHPDGRGGVWFEKT